MLTCMTWHSMQCSQKVTLIMLPNPWHAFSQHRYCPVTEFVKLSSRSSCSVHVYVHLFIGFFAVSRYITLYLGQQLEVCFCLSLPFWCVQRPCTRQGCCTPNYKFGYWFWRNGEEVCTCDALRAEIIVAHTFSPSLTEIYQSPAFPPTTFSHSSISP